MRANLAAPEKFVIFVLLALGLIACFAIPLSAGYDEETHFIRAWEMAHLYFIPNEQLGAKLPFPAIYWELSYRRQPIVDAVEPGFWTKYSALPIDAHDYMYANVETRSVYSPALLLPQALALRYLGLSLRLPALTVYYACRLVGLLSYLLLGWLAVRLIPYAKWLLAILIVSPMALFQASTISADTISNGIGFLFLGASLAIAARKEITWKAWVGLLLLVALLFVAKVNLVFLALLPFLLIPPSRFKMKFGYVLLAGAALALLLFEIGGWNLVAYSKFTRALTGASPLQQLLFIASNPVLFIKIIAGDVWTNTVAYMQGWVGVYGYNYWPVPGLVYLLYPLAVICSLFQPQGVPGPDRRARLVLASLFVLGYLLTIASLYVAFTPVGSLLVAGVQGRYFTIIMPLLFLALHALSLRGGALATKQSPPSAAIGAAPEMAAGQAVNHPPHFGTVSKLGGLGRSRKADPINRPPPSAYIPTVIPIILALSSLLLYTGGLLLSYHVSCGSEYYRLGLCYQPVYKNWAPESSSSPVLSSKLTLTQEIVPACDGMTEMRVWVNSNGTDPSATTNLLLRAPTEQKDVVRQTFMNAEVAKGAWLTVTFNPQWKSRDELYLLTLAGSAADGIRVGLSEKPEYTQGKLTENETAMGQDLLFQYGCVAGLEKLWGTTK